MREHSHAIREAETGNKVVITLVGFYEHPDLECDLGYWKYLVETAFPFSNSGELVVVASGVLREGFPNKLCDKKHGKHAWIKHLVQGILRRL